MNLERITVEFHAEKDRLKVRMSFDQKAEIPFWLTRGLVKRIQPVLLHPQQGNGVDLALGDTLPRGPMKLVQDMAVKAEWDMSLAVPTFAHAPAEDDAGGTVN